MTTTTPTIEPAPKKKFNRDEIRTAILDAKPRAIIVEAFGIEIEVREPLMRQIMELNAKNVNEDGTPKANNTNAMAESLAAYLYVPGTDEKVFDENDVDVLQSAPFGEDIRKIQEAINKLIGVDKRTKELKGN